MEIFKGGVAMLSLMLVGMFILVELFWRDEL